MRTYEPGHPFRIVMILEGEENIGKTGALQVLAFEDYFVTLSADFKDRKELVEQQRGAFICELGELASMHRSTIEDVKRHLSATEDVIRLAYRRNEETFKRRNVFVGTTNRSKYLTDPGANTRFAPVKCGIPAGGKVDFARLKGEVHQLWAEAVAAYRAMRKAQPRGVLPLDLSDPESLRIVEAAREEAREVLPSEMAAEVIEAWLNKPLTKTETEDGIGFEIEDDDEVRYWRCLVSVADVLENLGGHPAIRGLGRGAHIVIGHALGSLEGWTALGHVRRGGKKARFYARRGSSQDSVFEEMPDDPEEDLLGC